jgi:signal transduction histidine kinase
MNPMGESSPAAFPDQSSGWVVRLPYLRNVLAFGLFQAAFYFAYRYGMSFSHATASPFWFPDSVLLCALLLSPPRWWWLFLLAPLPIRLLSEVARGIPVWFLLTTSAIDAARNLVTAALLRRFAKRPFQLATAQSFALFCLIAALLVPAVFALGGAAARHALNGEEFWMVWERWFLGNALAQLVVTPAILYCFFFPPWKLRPPSRKRLLEAALLALGLVLSGFLAFRTRAGMEGFDDMRFCALLPFLFWAGMRFGMFGACAATGVIAFISVNAALGGYGPFAGLSAGATAMGLQHFLLLRAAPLYLVAILIEQKNEAESEARKQRAELAHAARVSTMGQLSSALAHELNQPLAAILRNAEAAEIILRSPSPDLDELRAIVRDIRMDDRRAGDVIERLRAFLKRHNLEVQLLNVGKLVKDVVALARPEAVSRRAMLETDVPGELPLVRGDRVHLQQVLLNLIMNGMDALNNAPDSQRCVTIRARLDEDRRVEISVSDTGHGIPGDKIGRVFEPFFTTKTGGMGLGLSVSRTLVEAHGGRIGAENNSAGGATFRFTLPAAQERSPS